MKKKIIKIIFVMIIIIVVLVIIIIIIVSRMAASMGVGSAGVADYEKRIEIWNTVAGNNERSKLDDMNIRSGGNPFIYTLLFASSIVGEEYKDKESIVDTFTYLYEIKGGYEKETYEDSPYLIPYLSEGSDLAVIVIPGGGFGYKSMDGSDGEGKDVAETLQKNGISAFVLHYRSNPYEYPIPQLDVQRAVRYLKYNAEKYSIAPEKIGLIGFSAGGFEIGSYINQIQGNNLLPDAYKMDEIDRMDDTISTAAMIYPALSFNDNVPMLFCLFDDKDVRNETTRKDLLELTDLKKYVNHSVDIPQFIAWGTKDSMVGIKETPKYIKKANEAGVDITEIRAEGQNHGFAQKYYIMQYIDWLKARNHSCAVTGESETLAE